MKKNKKKRALRRHHRIRLLKKRFKEHYHGIGNGWDGYGHDGERLEACAFLVDTPTPCSCHMCGNPRKSKWYKGKQKLTLQERKEEEKNKIDFQEITTE